MNAIRAALPIAFAMLATTGAMAQFADPNIALSGSAGAMTCGQFTHLSPRHRDAIVRQLNTSAPPMSLAAPPAGFGTPAGAGKGRHRSTIIQAPIAPLAAGAIVSACSAVSPTETLRNAYSRANPDRPINRGRGR